MTKLTVLKMRISQNVRFAADPTLRKLTEPVRGKFYRKQWCAELGIAWSQGADDYIKRKAGKGMGIYGVQR